MLNTIMILFILSEYSVTYKSKMAAVGQIENWMKLTIWRYNTTFMSFSELLGSLLQLFLEQDN